MIFTRCLVSVWREEAVTLTALNKYLSLATVMSRCVLKLCRVCVCCRVCVSMHACSFGKNRGWVSLKCIVDLVKLFLWLCLWPSVSLCSIMMMQSGKDSFHWVFSLNRHCVLPPEGLQFYTGNSFLLSNRIFIFVCSFSLSIYCTSFIRSLTPSLLSPTKCSR